MGLIFRDQYNIELPLLQHSIEGAFPFSDGDGLVGVIILDVDGAEQSLLVVVVRAFIFVEFEVTVTTCIYINVSGRQVSRHSIPCLDRWAGWHLREQRLGCGRKVPRLSIDDETIGYSRFVGLYRGRTSHIPWGNRRCGCGLGRC